MIFQASVFSGTCKTKGVSVLDMWQESKFMEKGRRKRVFSIVKKCNSMFGGSFLLPDEPWTADSIPSPITYAYAYYILYLFLGYLEN